MKDTNRDNATLSSQLRARRRLRRISYIVEKWLIVSALGGFIAGLSFCTRRTGQRVYELSVGSADRSSALQSDTLPDEQQDYGSSSTIRGDAYQHSPPPSTPSSALEDAIRANDFKQVKTLLAQRVKVNVRLDGAWTPLSLAVELSCDIRIVKILVEHGANVNIKEWVEDPKGETLLMYAAGYGTPKVVKLLISAGAYVNAGSADGEIALMEAAEFANAENMSVLLSRGALVNARTRDGMTALMYAAQCHEYPSLEVLLRAGARIDAIDRNGETALMYAAQSGNLAGVKALLAHGADVNARDLLGCTPLMYSVMDARSSGSLTLVKMLLSQGAKGDAVDYGGKSALDYGLTRRNTGIDLDSRIRVALIEAGAREESIDSIQGCPLHYPY